MTSSTWGSSRTVVLELLGIIAVDQYSRIILRLAGEWGGDDPGMKRGDALSQGMKEMQLVLRRNTDFQLVNN